MSFSDILSFILLFSHCLHFVCLRHWNLEDALAYYDDQIDEENNLLRIFIEPPDEANTSCEESDDEVPATITTSNCEIVLRNGKRYKSNDSKSEVIPKQFKKTSGIKIKKNSRGSKPITTNECDEQRSKNIRPKLVAKRKKSSGVSVCSVDEPENVKGTSLIHHLNSKTEKYF